MDFELIKVRIISIGYKLLAGVVAVVLAGVISFLSEDAKEIITSELGTGVISMLVLAILDEVTKHLRNVRIVKEWKLGGNNEQRPILL